ncbi:MAG TPA: hypothetical protein VFK16_05700 [Gemmatimonadaceae bacterium]|nr:hypothetical protein [Gemmatimonadaceae bacterium]
MKRSRLFRVQNAVMTAARALAATALLVPGAARAQAGLTHLDDATIVPKGEWRLQAITAWTRFDSRFLPAGAGAKTSPLGADFSFDSLGAAQLPALSTAQSDIAAMTHRPFRLSLGTSRAAADARVVVTPIGAEYGLTHRLTLGAMIPLVRTRMSIMLRMNADSASAANANVGINPATVNAAALAQDSSVVRQLTDASNSLQGALQACQANPAANSDCGTLLARAADVSTLAQDAETYALVLGRLYGQNSTARGAGVVPLQGTTADSLIRAYIVGLDSSFQAFRTATPRVTSAPVASGGPVGVDDLASFLKDPAVAGFDSLKTTVRVAPGDLELSARYLLFDGFSLRDSAPPAGLHSRATLTATWRLPTGQLATASNPLDIGTGRGTSSAGARLALYSQWGTRLGLGATAQYITSFGKTTTGRYPMAGGAPFPAATLDTYSYTPGAVVSFSVAPRIMVGRLLGVNVMYDYLHVAANDYGDPQPGNYRAGTPPFSIPLPPPTPVAILNGISSTPGTTQAMGFGITYSTVTEYDRGKAVLPIDITFTHLEALSGAARMPKFFRDQIQLRFYYRRHRNR